QRLGHMANQQKILVFRLLFSLSSKHRRSHLLIADASLTLHVPGHRNQVPNMSPS
ncbi:hypothetical protein TorRG33x02_087480, partial [Trema orientale]